MRGGLTGAQTAEALLQGELTPLRFQKAAQHLKNPTMVQDFLARLAPLDAPKRTQIETGMRLYLPT